MLHIGPFPHSDSLLSLVGSCASFYLNFHTLQTLLSHLCCSPSSFQCLPHPASPFAWRTKLFRKWMKSTERRGKEEKGKESRRGRRGGRPITLCAFSVPFFHSQEFSLGLCRLCHRYLSALCNLMFLENGKPLFLCHCFICFYFLHSHSIQILICLGNENHHHHHHNNNTTRMDGS